MPRTQPDPRIAALVVLLTVVAAIVWLGLSRGGAPRPSPSAGAALRTATAPSGVEGSATAAASPRTTETAAPATPPPATPPVAVLVGAGDIADCASEGDEATANLLDAIDGTVFTLGDNAYESGTLDEYRRCYDPSWGRDIERTMPVPGNHDYATAGAAGYYRYFGTAAGDPEKGFYAYDRGSWRIYALNSNCAAIGGCEEGSAQEGWLRGDLAANPRTCVLAMWHHPLFSSGQHGNNPATRDLWRALYDAGADLVLTGHDHIYERFAPQTANARADPERGIVELVVGTGGRSHYDLPTIRENSLVRDNTTYGVLRLDLAEGGWTFEFLSVPGGGFTDSGSGTCH